ncbi:TadE/TadG family type IV pilus assembly protein [Actinoplanes sp. NPDC051851]|uniref:TadE/TadG family type IV pilus assembly protein n=1 Tax=Actinoplanes sp. NPDC051851 TaxID=3154753 RepID=UPI00342306C6
MAAVETAIVMPLLLLLLFGIVDMGRLLQQYIQLTEAAREGARYGALNSSVTVVKAKVGQIAGTSALIYPTTSVCTGSSGVGTDAKVVVARTFAPITPMVGLVNMVGSGPMNTIVITATGVMSCVG